MGSEFDSLLAIVDNFGMLVLALYIIRDGMQQMQQLYQDNAKTVALMLTQQQANNQQLADLVRDLCQPKH